MDNTQVLVTQELDRELGHLVGDTMAWLLIRKYTLACRH
jgi:hypothetical protein